MNRVAVAAGEFSAEAWSRPAGECGGDFVILRRRASGLRAIVGDVSGHGDEAAGAAMRVWRRIQDDVDAELTPELLSSWNRAFLPLLAGRFVCLTVCDACNSTHSLTVANCGNPEVLIRRQAGRVDRVESRGTLLGMVEPRYWIAPIFVRTWVAPEDRVLCFTDGITDQFNQRREFFGIERVSRVMGRVRSTPVRTLRRCIQAFSRVAAGFADDVTIVVMQQVAAARSPAFVT